MTSAAVLTHLIVGVVLLAAAAAKLRSPLEVPAAFTALSVPRRLAVPALMTAFPWAEGGLGVLVLVAWGPLLMVATIAASLLLLAYAVLVARVVLRDQVVECACFGAFTAGAVDRRTVARNVALTVVGALGVIDALTGHSVPQWIRDAGAEGWSWLAGCGVVALVLWLILSGGSPTPRAGADDVPENDLADYLRLPIPYAGLQHPDGGNVYLRELARSNAVLLIFVSFGCSPCLELLAELPGWRESLPIDVRAVVRDASTAPADVPEGLLVDRDGEVLRALDASGTPSAVLLGADGLLAGGPVLGTTAVRDLVAQVREQLDAEPEMQPAHGGGLKD